MDRKTSAKQLNVKIFAQFINIYMHKFVDYIKKTAAVIAALSIIFGSVWVFAESRGSKVWAEKEKVGNIEKVSSANQMAVANIKTDFNAHTARTDVHVVGNAYVTRHEWNLRKEAVEHDIELIRKSQEEFYQEQRAVNREQRMLMNEMLRRLPE